MNCIKSVISFNRNESKYN